MSGATRPEALFSLATLKTWLGVTDASKDAELVLLGNAVSAALERETKRIYVTRTVSEQLTGRGNRDIWLTQYPVVAVNSLTLKRSFTDTPTTILGSEYSVIADQGRLILLYTTAPAVPGNVAVSYDAGYGLQDSTDDDTLVTAAAVGVDWVKYLWDQKKNGAISVSSLSMQGMNVLLKQDWPPSLRDGVRGLTRARS